MKDAAPYIMWAIILASFAACQAVETTQAQITERAKIACAK